MGITAFPFIAFILTVLSQIVNNVLLLFRCHGTKFILAKGGRRKVDTVNNTLKTGLPVGLNPQGKPEVNMPE
ncbi:MAG: hypothetical protein ACLSB9_19145 [Hydrogeniiclostridium mannosilyticum]